MPRRSPTHRPSNAGDPRVQKRQHGAAHDRQRPSASQRGYDAAWRKLRRLIMAERPLCVDCLAEGLVKVGEAVDHIIPIEQRPDLRLDPNNLAVRCHSHHNSKTAREDGGFGRKKKER